MKCPACHRETYSKKWNACSAEDCSLNHQARAQEVFAMKRLEPSEVRIVSDASGPLEVETPLQNVSRETKRNDAEVFPGPRFVQRPKQPKGRPRKYASAADRQRAYRERKRADANSHGAERPEHAPS